MNISVSRLKMFSSFSNSEKDLESRQMKTENEVNYWENKKTRLKGVKCRSVEDVADKLEMLRDCEDQIAAAKKSFNYSQMFHVLDEAKEQGEAIAEETKNLEPKTPEERREEKLEEAREAAGMEENGGVLEEVTESLEEVTEEIAEQVEEQQSQLEMELEAAEATEPEKLQSEIEELAETSETEQAVTARLQEKLDETEIAKKPYKRINVRI